jgi:hypothetical protein
MTVSALVTRNDITATASQTSFTYTFRVLEATDMDVYQNGALLASGYTVNDVGVTTGGTVTLDVGVPVGQIVSLVLAMPLDRTTNYQNSGDFLAGDVNGDFDKIYIGAIQNENESGRSLRLQDVEPPTAGVDMTLPLKAARLGKYLSFNSVTGAPEVVAGTGGSVTDASLVNYTPAGTGAVVTTVQAKLRETISVMDFGAVGDGVTDDTAAIQAALVAAAGATVYVPSGTYVVTSTLTNNIAPTQGAFGPAIRIVGDGMIRTIFDNRVANGPMIDIDSANHGGSYEAVMGALLQAFMIKTTTSPANSDGIRILNGYEVVIDQLYIKGLTGNGIEMKNGLYLDDGWNMVKVKNCWIDSCAKWGIKADGSAGRNEGSFTHLEHVFFQTNGTASASVPPPSGGMIYKGQILTMDQCAFANGNQNVGLFVKGESGLAQTVTLRETAFENCYKKSLYVTGITQMSIDNCQVYNNDDFVATTGMEFDGSAYTIKNVDINGVVVRAASGNNPFTAFKISGANAELISCSVQNAVWDNFDYAGQVRQSGFKDKPTSLANKTSAQDIYATTSTMLFNVDVSDIQDSYDTTTGRYTVAYESIWDISGQLTITSLDANASVTISLYDVSAASNVVSSVYHASGNTTESFRYDFTLELGVTGTTRSYEIRAIQDSGTGTKALDVSSAFNNTFSARRIPTGEIKF